MAFLGRLDLTVTDRDGVAQTTATHGAYAHVRRQGATVNGNQSGTTPFTVTVNHVGGVVAGDSVAINAGTATYLVAAVTSTTIQLTTFAGTLALLDDDRLVPASQGVSLYNDTTATEPLSFPLSLDANGNALAWCRPGLYDILIAYSNSSSNRLIQDWQVVGGDHVFDVSKGPYYAKFDGSTDDYLAIQKALNDATQATWPSQDAVGGVVLMPSGIGMTSQPLVVPDRVVLRGQGVYATKLKAHSSFVFNGTTDAVVRLGTLTVFTDTFNVRVESCSIDCNDMANSIGIYSASANEDCGMRDVTVQRPILKGIFFDTLNCQNWRMSHVGVQMSTSASAASAVGIDLGAAVAGSNVIEGASIGSYSGSTQRMLYAIRARGSATNFSLDVSHCHLEESVSGLYIATNNVTARNLSGLSSTTSVVRVESGVGNVTLFAISRHGATNSLVHVGRGQTLTTDLGWFLDGVSSDAQFMGSDPAISWRVKNAVQWDGIQKVASTFRFRDIVTVASAATINSDTQVGNYWNITGTTTITAIGDVANNSGRIVWMKFASAGCQVTDNGGTLNLNGNFISTAESILCIACDGTNWVEVGRSNTMAKSRTSGPPVTGDFTTQTNCAVVSATGTDTMGSVVLNPAAATFSIVYTFKDGAYAAAPLIHVSIASMDASPAGSGVGMTTAPTTTTTTFTAAFSCEDIAENAIVSWTVLPA